MGCLIASCQAIKDTENCGFAVSQIWLAWVYPIKTSWRSVMRDRCSRSSKNLAGKIGVGNSFFLGGALDLGGAQFFRVSSPLRVCQCWRTTNRSISNLADDADVADDFLALGPDLSVSRIVCVKTQNIGNDDKSDLGVKISSASSASSAKVEL